MTYYRIGSNQFVMRPKTYALEIIAGLAVSVYVISLLVAGKPAIAKDQLYLENIEFGTQSALMVEAEPRLPMIPELKAPKGMKTEIYEYLIEKFGDHAGDAIAIIRTCENGTFDPRRESGINKHKDGHESIDIGVMQINVDVKNTAEREALKDYKYNIDRGYAKWKMGDGGKYRNSFYLWTCAKVINQFNYVDAMNGK